MHNGAFCSSKANPQKCPHLAIPGSDFCQKHQEMPKTIPDLFLELKKQFEETTQKLNHINSSLIMLGARLQRQPTAPLIPPQELMMVPSDPAIPQTQPTNVIPGHYFLNETHELPRIRKSKRRKDQREARKRKA